MTIHIKEPFYGAYKLFGWGDKIAGIGFKQQTIDMLAKWNERLVVTIGKDKNTKYLIGAVRIKELAKQYNSLYKVKYDTYVYVIPQTELQKV